MEKLVVRAKSQLIPTIPIQSLLLITISDQTTIFTLIINVKNRCLVGNCFIFPFNKQPQTALPPNAVPPQLPNPYFNQVNQYRMNPPPDSNNPNNLKQHPEYRQFFET